MGFFGSILQTNIEEARCLSRLSRASWYIHFVQEVKQQAIVKFRALLYNLIN